MAAPIPLPPPTQPPDDAALELIARIHAYAASAEGTDGYARVVAGLQHVFTATHSDWLRTMARAQGAGLLSHRELAAVTGYASHRSAQDRVYEGRELLERDSTTP